MSVRVLGGPLDGGEVASGGVDASAPWLVTRPAPLGQGGLMVTFLLATHERFAGPHRHLYQYDPDNRCYVHRGRFEKQVAA